MAAEEINRCTSYSAILFAHLAWLSGVLAAALPYWITTKGTTFEYMNLGFWKYCKQIDLERTGCHDLSDPNSVEPWLVYGRILGCTTTVTLTTCWVLANLYVLPSRIQGSRKIVGFLVFFTCATTALEVATMVFFCFGRDDHDFIDFDGPVRMSHSFYLAMTCVTFLINSCMLVCADVLETRKRKKNAYTPPTAQFMENVHKEAARMRAEGKFAEFEDEEYGYDGADNFPPEQFDFTAWDD